MASELTASTKRTRTRGSTGRFTRTWGTHELLNAVADVALAEAGDGEEPWMVGQARFDRRAQEMKLDLPIAANLRRRFNLRLSDVIKRALTESGKRMPAGRAVGDQGVAPEMPWELMLLGVKACHRAIGRVPSPSDYDAWVDDVATTRRRRGFISNKLPMSLTILARGTAWPDVLVQAGVCEKASDVSFRPAQHVEDPAVIFGRFLDEVGKLPPRSYFFEWCRRKDIPLSQKANQWGVLVSEVRAQRTAAGLTTPAETTPARELPELPAQVEVTNRRRSWTREDALVSLRRYAELHQKGAEPRRRDYGDARKKDHSLVPLTTLQKFGGFQELCAEAGI